MSVLGLLKDIKVGEYRTILTPIEIETIVADGHDVLVEKDAGAASGFPDSQYEKAGAQIIHNAAEIWAQADLITKVKEIHSEEYALLREDQIVLTCIHPAAHPSEVDALLERKVTALSAEDSHRYGSPNCEAAGKQGALFGLESMLSINGGKGKYVGGLAGTPPMNVLILGNGITGQGAIEVLYALGARITVAGRNLYALRELTKRYPTGLSTMISSQEAIKHILPQIDMVINCVKWDKGNTKPLITRDMLLLMEPGSVLVDISNDTNGAIESFRETTHEHPRYIDNGVVHYCVSNIPAAIPQSTTISYAAAMAPHIRNLLNLGVKEACTRDGFLRRSLVTYRGYLTHEETSAVQNRPWIQPEKILGINEAEMEIVPKAAVARSENYYGMIETSDV